MQIEFIIIHASVLFLQIYALKFTQESGVQNFHFVDPLIIYLTTLVVAKIVQSFRRPFSA